MRERSCDCGDGSGETGWGVVDEGVWREVSQMSCSCRTREKEREIGIYGFFGKACGSLVEIAATCTRSALLVGGACLFDGCST